MSTQPLNNLQMADDFFSLYLNTANANNGTALAKKQTRVQGVSRVSSRARAQHSV